MQRVPRVSLVQALRGHWVPVQAQQALLRVPLPPVQLVLPGLTVRVRRERASTALLVPVLLALALLSSCSSLRGHHRRLDRFLQPNRRLNWPDPWALHPLVLQREAYL